MTLHFPEKGLPHFLTPFSIAWFSKIGYDVHHSSLFYKGKPPYGSVYLSVSMHIEIGHKRLLEAQTGKTAKNDSQEYFNNLSLESFF